MTSIYREYQKVAVSWYNGCNKTGGCTMPKSTDQKAKLLALREIFIKQTDENHHLTMPQVITELKRYGISAERKGLYDDFRILGEYGIEILSQKHKGIGYYVASREFDLAELKLLIDSIQSSKFITEKKTLSLIKKVEGLCSKHEAQQLQRQVVVMNRIKSMNESVYYNVDAIQEAMSANSQITFQYFDYDIKKVRHYHRKGELYKECPFALIAADDHYYLLAYNEQEQKFKHYRVDKMAGVEATGEPRQGVEAYKALDMAAYVKHTFSMFGGEVERVTIRFSNHLSGVVIDRFGRGVNMLPADEKHFEITVPVAVSNPFFAWLFGLGKAARITAPQSVVDKMTGLLESVRGIYGQ